MKSKENESIIWGKTVTDTKFYKKVTKCKNIGLWVSKETEVIYKKSKSLFEENMIKNINPAYGDFVIFNSFNIMNTFFPDAKRLGVDPLEYATEKIQIMLEAYKSDRRNKINISSVVKLRDEKIDTINSNFIDNIRIINEG